jgi:hypothetical protein
MESFLGQDAEENIRNEEREVMGGLKNYIRLAL